MGETKFDATTRSKHWRPIAARPIPFPSIRDDGKKEETPPQCVALMTEVPQEGIAEEEKEWGAQNLDSSLPPSWYEYRAGSGKVLLPSCHSVPNAFGDSPQEP